MSNDLNTISGVLAEAVDKLEANLNSMGVYATYDPSEGYLELLDEILNIAPSVGGINLSTAISLTNTPSVVKAHDTVLLSATVHADYDDKSQANIDMNGYLQGATVSFYDGNTLLGTGVTGADGVATFTVTDISYGSHSFKAEYDGTGTSYDSAVSSVLNVTAEHDYSLEFGQDSYTASGGSCNVTVTLLDNGVPVAGETVSLTGSDSSLYSGITNQNGIASLSISGLSGIVTYIFTATYGTATATTEIIVQNYLFYDACDSADGLSNYATPIGINQTITTNYTQYDSTENAYWIRTDGDWGLIPIPPLDGQDNFKITAKFKMKGGTYLDRGGLGLLKENTTNPYWVWRIQGDGWSGYCKKEGSSEPDTRIVNLNGANSKYFTMELTVQGNTHTCEIYDGSSLLGALTDYFSVENPVYGLFVCCGSSYGCYVKEIKAEPI